MNRLRLASWAAVASLGLVSGCQSSSCGNGGLFGGMSHRGQVIYDGPVNGTPVSSMPYGDCCQGGPMLGDPSIYGYAMPYNGGTVPYSGAPVPYNGSVPPMATIPPRTSLPTPTPGAAPPLAPVPGPSSPGFATPTPAQPSGRFR